MTNLVGDIRPVGRDAVRRVCVLARLWEPGLGDLVQRNIILHLVRRAYPGATVTYVVPAGVAARFGEFLHHHTYADDLLPCPDSGDESATRWGDFLDALRAGAFDLCIVDPDSRGLGGVQAQMSGIPRRIGYAVGHTGDVGLTEAIRMPRPVFGQPDLYDYALGLATALGIPVARPADVMAPLPYQPAVGESLAGPVVALHPGGAPHWNRRWPQAGYAELGRRLAPSVGTLLLVGEAVEASELRELRDRMAVDPAKIRVVAGSSLNELANLLVRADVLVGSDSAPAHLSAALGRSTLVIYGPTATEFMWTRMYPHHHGINRRYPCQLIRNMPRGPGNVTTPCEHSCHFPYAGAAGPYPRCLTDISVDEVYRAVTAGLSDRATAASGAGSVA